MRNDGHDEFDQILDSALTSYCARQPLPGIEQRVIARLPRPKTRDAWLRWVVPVPVLAGGLAVMSYVAPYWIKPEASRVNSRINGPQRVVQSRPTAAAAKVTARLHRAPAVKPRVTKSAVFPAPSPLTAEERALMQLAALNPEVLHNAQISQEHRSQPLTVEPIHIPLLRNSDSTED